MLFKLHFLSGDLLYIDVVTLEDVQVNITASTGGYFVNRLVLLMYLITKNSNDDDDDYDNHGNLCNDTDDNALVDNDKGMNP